jgi:CAAX protease family protein
MRMLETSGAGIEPPRPRLSPLWRALLYVVLLLLAVALSGALLDPDLPFLGPLLPASLRANLPALVSSSGGPARISVSLDEVLATALAALLATALVTALVERRPFRSVGLWWGRGAAQEVSVGLALGVGLQTGIFALLCLCGWVDVTLDGQAQGQGMLYGLLVVVEGLLLFLPAAFTEELTVRGYLLPTLTEAWGRTAALVVTSALFGALHDLNPNASPLAFLGTAAAGVLLGLAYQWTGCLWLPWALHFAWNFAEGTLWGMPVSGLQAPSVIRAHLRGPVLWTGGAFGPEAGLLGLIAILMGILLLARLRRRELATDGHRCG